MIYSHIYENGTINFRYSIVSKHISTNYKLDTPWILNILILSIILFQSELCLNIHYLISLYNMILINKNIILTIVNGW